MNVESDATPELKNRILRGHPVNVLADHLGRSWAIGAWVIGLLVVALALDQLGASTLAGAVVVAWFVGFITAQEAPPTSRRERERKIAEARDRYAAGRITHADFENRVEFLLDDRNALIRRRVEDAPNVGPERSAAIAARFESVQDVETAAVDELTNISGIGEETAAGIVDHVRGGDP